MKRVISSIVVVSLICTACSTSDKVKNQVVSENTQIIENVTIASELKDENSTEKKVIVGEVKYKGLNDSQLLSDIKDKVHKQILELVNDKDMIIEDIDAVYISQDYIDELTYNSKPSIYFGYTLEEVENIFDGKKYIFTVDDSGKTIIKEFEKYDDTNERIIKNVAIGTGVILVTVTVSFATAGTAPAISLVLATSAKTGAVMAVSQGSISAIAAGLITGIKTKNMDKALKQATLSGSEGFKCGAIAGEILGGVYKFTELKNASNITKNVANEANFISKSNKFSGLTMDDVALIQKESKYPLEIVKNIKSMPEYYVYKKAGCFPVEVGGKPALVQEIDLFTLSEYGGKQVTNLERMQLGGAPVYYENGKEFTYQLHHINQDPNGLLAVLKEGAEHQGNASILNTAGKEGVDHGYEWSKIVSQFWKNYSKRFE